ncbi:MAG TPA: hypothetical protein VHX15_21735 [Frankiaceae bacterium]|jgi:hypothetical protein|nr:hypothetical protein [Frankiaceae bacterium]
MTPRNNGLRASAYAALIEIEESLGDPMLAALAARQIAAYVQPTPGPGGTTRLTLYVDAMQRAPAGAVLAGLTPAMAGDPPADSEPPRDVVASDPTADSMSDPMADDAAFAALVEAFHRTPDERTWPDAEDLPAEAPPQPEQHQSARPADTVLPAVPPRRITKKFDPATDADRRRPGTPMPTPKSDPGYERQRDAFDHEPADAADELSDDEEHYVPPPLPRLDPAPFAIRWALVGLMLGLAMLLVPTFFDFGHRTSMDVAGVLFILGSGAILVSRLRDRSPDDPDDGAVV